MEPVLVDLSKIPKETLDWLKSVGAVDFDSPVVFSVLQRNGEWMNYTYDYLVNTPTNKLKVGYKKHSSLHQNYNQRHKRKFRFDIYDIINASILSFLSGGAVAFLSELI